MKRFRRVARVFALLVSAVALVTCADRGEDATPSTTEEAVTAGANDNTHKNHLEGEKSPYLQQHASNPVDWYPWGDEAFDLSRREDKPIFLSIGYSTCHWCHVMEHESFEDAEVATALNEAFVCIKVDREERPDIDNVYMTVCQMMTGSGGWPMTIIMTPGHEPFFAATYIPKAGLLQLTARVRSMWEGPERSQLVEHAGKVAEALASAAEATPGDVPGIDEMSTAYTQLAARFDSSYGGFGTRPKFPTPHNLTFLLRWWYRKNDAHALEMVEHTLDRMRRGGMYDQIGYGFHRYSTDERWLVPHFEKMLYDQALLAIAYTDAWQATGNADYRRTAGEIFEYVLRDMTSEDGAFYSAEDADSEGEEGKFYVWSAEQLRAVLGDDADFAMRAYGATESGNYHEEATGKGTGSNILTLAHTAEELARSEARSVVEVRERLESVRNRLFAEREKRVHPHKDDKVLTDWNGLMIAALARAGRVFDEPRYVDAARRAAAFFEKRMKSGKDGALLHRFRDDDAGIPGMVDDYAFQAFARLELYETTFETGHLEAAIAHARYLREHFWDEGSGGMFFTANGAEALISRPKEVYDGAVPSGNSVAMLVFVRLSRLTGDPRWERDATRIGQAFSSAVGRAPSAFTQFLQAVDLSAGPSWEVVVVGDPERDDTRVMLSALRAQYSPRKVVLFRASSGDKRLDELAPFTRLQTEVDGRATAYVCRNHACELPTTEPSEMQRMLSVDR